MITTNSAWDAKNAQLGKKPIYVFAIGGQDAVYSTHNLTAEGVTGAPDFRAWLKTPQGSTQSIDVLRGSSSIGELECEVIDQQGELRQLVGGTTLEGASATLSVGYPGLAYSDFVRLQSYQLYKITPSRGYTSWMFRSRDRQIVAKRTVYTNPENGQLLSAENPWILQGTPAEITQAIYLFALERPAAEVDRDAMVRLDSAAEGLYQAARVFQFHLTEAFEAKQFLETEVFKAGLLYPVITNLGQISLRGFRPPVAGPQPVYAFTEENIILLPEIDRQAIVNEVLFKIDYDGNDYRNELIFIDATSVSTYGQGLQQTVESKGLRTELGAQWFCQEVASRLFRRFAGTPLGLRGGAPTVQIEAFLMTLPVWVGDYVTVTHHLMPDLTTGALGVTERLYEVIDREPDYARGRMRYKLLDTGLTGLQAAHKWAPSDRNFVVGTSEVY